MALVNKIHPTNFPVNFLNTLIKITKHFEKLEIESELFDDTLKGFEPRSNYKHTEWEFINIKVRDNPTYYFEVYMRVFDDGGVALSCQHFPSGKGKSKEDHFIATQHFENLITNFA
ncbi:MAG TPA: hypothetical protein VJ111_12585, partial [Chitinophagaceae bacterium]|nr:hypothetical protein [Chitinophagaceae bacterium]